MISARILLSLIYCAAITGLDCRFYGIVYQENKSRSWLFQPLGPNGECGWHYRAVQKVWEIGGIAILFFVFRSWWQVAGLVLAHYFLTFDLFYYLLLDQIEEAKKFQSPYWLSHWFDAGFWALRPYSWEKFCLIGFTGLVLAAFGAGIS